ncbi:MAG TPA: hypothetical protein VGH83_12010 [Candidatus Acidoferrum sp.]|jgi:hypothetical protein
MATTLTTTARLQFIGIVLEIAGIASLAGGLILSLHHWPTAAALIGGGTAFFVGKKFRAAQ